MSTIRVAVPGQLVDWVYECGQLDFGTAELAAALGHVVDSRLLS